MANRRELDPDRNMYDWAAYELLRLRKVHGASHRVVGEILRKDRTLFSKIEAGESRLQEEDADRLDEIWETGGLLGRIIRWAKSRHSSEWRKDRARREAHADQICVWAPGWVPALAQTENYIRAKLTESGRRNVDAALREALDRQEALNRSPRPLVWLYLDQDALEHPVGGPEVMREQLAKLLELAESPSWAVRVVSRNAGGHVGRDGGFDLYSVGGTASAYTEALGPGRLVIDASEVDQYQVWFRQIGDVAESRSASIALIKAIMEEYR
ncbi:hypothetical protein BTM25_15670 [Actinomadura rubteroloni]|uniref:DUF5753 domain-containing protein n=1 Tax=Actinomadura rubteroloni TaxID=1926885 RepID=A0A2P4UQ30_9ACTN|nr:DUF5753 domain-containing protein [Actinomadura rubteroloni]POM27156.1 hypothetical protein BTM25_15670 [Actinomadura rubteroloni]